MSGSSTKLRQRVLRLAVYRVELVRERSVPFSKRRFEGPADAASLFRRYVGVSDREHLVGIWLDARQRMSGIHTISVGGLAQAEAFPREVFKAAIIAGAHALILVHNHPSGDPSPTPEDIAVTERLASVGDLVGIPLLDHVVVGDPGYSSLSALRLMPFQAMGADRDEPVEDADSAGPAGTCPEGLRPDMGEGSQPTQRHAPGKPVFLAVPNRTVTLNPIITVRPDPTLRPGQIEPLIGRLQSLIATILEQALRNVPATVEVEDVALVAAANHPVFPAVAGARTFSDTTAVAEVAETLMENAGIGNLFHDSTGRAFRCALWASYARVPNADLSVPEVFSLDDDAMTSTQNFGGSG